MASSPASDPREFPRTTHAFQQDPIFVTGDSVLVGARYPVGHYRVPRYIRGKRAVVEAVIEARWFNNEEEGFGRNAGNKRFYYRIAIPLKELWSDYIGPEHDSLRIEVYEDWLTRA